MTAGEKERKVYRVFQSISGDYDRMNDVVSLGMHRTWKRELVDAVCACHPRRVLDVCCGTGDLSLALARRLPAASVTGLDFSEEMLAVARRRQAGNLKLVNLEFVRGNAMELPFEENTFDCVTISFGLRNLPDYEKAVREFVRVLRPGGTFWCLDSYKPDPPAVQPFYKFYFRDIVGLQGKLLAGNESAYRWLYDSTEQFLSKQALLRLLKHCGLERAACKRYLFGAAACHRGFKAELKNKSLSEEETPCLN